ncbi:Maf family nucleotide pyrophosphatase [Plebeiibacterium marinum]|uniref:dTTP/UTP pyrophosphatase n=1 Tax=Plebeiibacterium marinum TaxID=2992111 RepID=A0AAE3SJV8_9BACT|nr:Maf family nucleotide pyrophosphatase [Plebeiobacterium marinum]MCW3805914.1 Maf family nucleotide pyrophosphatase [Plebeiobacterium marinum]
MISEHLKDFEVVLASKSPRRAQLLKEVGVDFTIGTKSGVEEIFPRGLSHQEVAKYLSELKSSVYQDEVTESNKLIITADTIVCLGDEVLGKPADRQDAIKMLQKLSGNKHSVITGVTLMSKNKKVTFAVDTKVYFKQMSNQEIEYYVDHYKPFDKAGAYGIQEWIGMTGIETIEGSYFNVVGLPVQKLYTELMKF